MAHEIQKIVLVNFRRFPHLVFECDKDLNVLVGDNESGKSTILLAVDLVLSGSRTKIELISLENLFNRSTVENYMAGNKRVEDLPHLAVELYLSRGSDPDLNGRNNSARTLCDGLRMLCRPNDQLSQEISETLQQDDPVFPFEYYEIIFQFFSGSTYSSYNRPIVHLLIDSTQINSEYATREYIKDLYNLKTATAERSRYQSQYRRHKGQFQASELEELNNKLESFSFVIRTTGKATLETDLTIAEDGITIDNKGKGKQNLIKTEFALSRAARPGRDIDILLLEEPENHLSHLNMKGLINSIQTRTGKQMFISTHSNLISARLDLRKCRLLNSNSNDVVSLSSLTEETSKFFMKAPNKNLLEFILSKKVILVEGDAEYILAEVFFEQVTGKTPQASNVNIIAVGGKTFKRYLELARLLQIRTAVVTDNDSNYQLNCVDNYREYVRDYIQVFADQDEKRPTFEYCVYDTNKQTCDELLGPGRRTLSVLEYMLKNKTEAAFYLLQHKSGELVAPDYIVDAIKWIDE